MAQEPITFVCVTKPNMERLDALLPVVTPYVDRIVLLIGEKIPQDAPLLTQDKVEVYYRKWDDNFVNQWNEWLKHVQTGWVLLCDDDEVPSEKMMQNLGAIVDASSYGNKYCLVKFQCNSIYDGVDNGPDEYWREIFFRRAPGMHYQSRDPFSGCHQFMVGYQNNRGVVADLVYYHIKSNEDAHRNAARNYFIYGIWPHEGTTERREEWHELRSVLAAHYPDVETFADLDKVLVAGKVHPNLIDWMERRFKEYETHHEYNEMRALRNYYFNFLHPEELTS